MDNQQLEELLRQGAAVIPVGGNLVELQLPAGLVMQVAESGLEEVRNQLRAEFLARWAEAGFEICSTGGPCWAAVKIVDKIRYQVSDYMESAVPSPFGPLLVVAYDEDSGEPLALDGESGEVIGLAAVELRIVELSVPGRH